MSARRLVLRPELAFSDLDAALSASGWNGGSVLAFGPLVPGEPELARWQRGSARLEYTCNPAIWLRVLDAFGVNTLAWDALSDALEPLDEADILGLLGASSDEHVALGIFAARALRLAAATEPLEALAARAADPIARYARDALSG
ncbi:hypothetical protein [Solirubrobacter soli]|uniref:hypothetical protein n=1 Tax=Solirubrobacter soli TaxID=363832 RepID=UPI0003FEC720|nr:hypothetical protein [Solirubrobacter soli]